MQLEIGQEVDGYLIQSVIGRGGMGIVYKAEDVALSRQVALKVINPSMSRDEVFVRRFQSEARTLAVINSPHIVAIHALRKTDQGLFIVMEFVDGGDLSDQMQKGNLSVGETLPIISQLLRAFQVAHSAGVVHRDIKPPNIMISKSGEVKITDFGLAKMNQAGLTKSMTEGVIGTLYYMSPEQIRGEEVDQRSDLWSLGVVFYEMLCGSRPFEAAIEASVMYAIMNEPAVFPEKYQNSLPDELQQIIQRALEKDRDKRYMDATEMLVDFDKFAAGFTDMAATRMMPDSSRGLAAQGSVSQDDGQQTRASGSIKSATRTKEARTTGATKNRRNYFVAGGAVLLVIIGIALYFAFAGPDSLPPPSISLNSEPDQASVYVGGDFIGKTPIDDYEVEGYDLEGGGELIQVRIEHGGFVSVDTLLKSRTIHFIELRADESLTASSTDTRSVIPPEQSSDTDNSPSQQQTRPPAVGSVILQAFPAARAFVDGKEVPSREAYSLSVGSHTIKFVSATHGDAQTTVQIASRQTKNISVYFESDITISTRPSSIVFIDDELAGETPYVGKLGPGTYNIRVEKEGYTSTPNNTLLTIKATFNQSSHERLSFTLEQN